MNNRIIGQLAYLEVIIIIIISAGENDGESFIMENDEKPWKTYSRKKKRIIT